MLKKIALRKTRKFRIRKRISGTKLIPRISVFRSNKYIYAQAIDDESQVTVASSRDSGVLRKQKKSERANNIGKQLAEKINKLGIKKVVFDRSGYKYHGRVKALAEGLREGGIKF